MNALEKVLATYAPSMPAENWATIRNFVMKTMRARFAEHRDSRTISNGLYTIAGFADWVAATGVGKLNATVLRADIIDAYAAFRRGEVELAVAERERKALRTVAGLPNTPGVRAASTNAPEAVPYTRVEQDEIRRWAEGQFSDDTRRSATAIAALGLGCGLSATELMQVRGRDVVVLSDGLMGVCVNGRTVPVTAEWDDELRELGTGDPAEHLIRPRRTRRDGKACTNTIFELGDPRPSTQRMRATWLLAHVDAGTHIPTLITASGLTSSDFLRRVLPFATEETEHVRTRMLRLSTEVAR